MTHVLNDCSSVDRSIWRGIVRLLGSGAARRRQSVEGGWEGYALLGSFSLSASLSMWPRFLVPWPWTLPSCLHHHNGWTEVLWNHEVRCILPPLSCILSGTAVTETWKVTNRIYCWIHLGAESIWSEARDQSHCTCRHEFYSKLHPIPKHVFIVTHCCLRCSFKPCICCICSLTKLFLIVGYDLVVWVYFHISVTLALEMNEVFV